MYIHRAYAFDSDLSHGAMRSRWIDASGFAWIERDSDHLGEYLSAKVDLRPVTAMLRLVQEGPRAWCLDVNAVGPEYAVRRLVARLTEELLPAIGATSLRDAETYDVRGRLSDDGAWRNGLPPVDAARTMTEYLRAKTAHGREEEVARALDHVRGEWHARMFLTWCDGRDETTCDARGWEGRRVLLGPTLPRAEIGDLWFDVCELVPMVRLERAWFSLDEVAAWQLRAFVALADFVPRRLQVAPSHRAFDPARIDVLDPRRHVERVTQGEATLFAWWFGKSIPHRLDYQEADAALPAEADVWPASSTEWTSSRTSDDFDRVVVRRATVSDDPEDHPAMIKGAWDAPSDVYFRTSASPRTGLVTQITPGAPDIVLAEERTIRTVLDRTAFVRR